jgi:menaquinol-cytochrome c reductase cytochrome b/c subunit
MNRREKEQYLREYAVLKSKGKPFFPYIVAKDGVMLVIVVGTILLMAFFLGGTITSKADPTTTTWVPRPEWYYYFVFELLKVVKPSALTPLASVGIATTSMVLLFLLPFYDRSAERHPLRRPIATTAGILTIAGMTFLTWQGAIGGAPSSIDAPTPKKVTQTFSPAALALYERGKILVPQSGCLACHKIDENGNPGPGPNLSDIGDRLPRAAIAETLRNPTAPMPSFANLPLNKSQAITWFLSNLKKSNN